MNYNLDQSAIPRGIGRQTILRAIPRRMKHHFGEPVHWKGDDECLGNYMFLSESGAIHTVYAMAYDSPMKLTAKSRAAFWERSGISELHIGAKSPVEAETFKLWLLEKLSHGPSF